MRISGVAVRIVSLLGLLAGPGSEASLAQSASQSGPDGWRPFVISKPAPVAAPRFSQPDSSDARWKPRLPPQHDVLRASAGLGYVWQQDWGLEAGASGRIHGIQTDVTSLFTAGPMGIETPSVRMSLRDPRSGWGIEGGDMVTELRGLARGVRFSWGRSERHRPVVSVYLPNRRLNDTRTLLAYRDDVRLSSRLVAGGEVASDGSYFLRSTYVQNRFDLHASHRNVRGDDPTEDSALMASVLVAHGIRVRTGWRRFETPTDAGHSRLTAVHVPISGLFSLTFEDNRTKGRSTEDVSNAVVAQVLRGPVQFTQRYQWGSSEYLQVGGPFGMQTRQLQTSGSYAPTRWATIGLQNATQWLPDGRARQWQELQAALTLTRRTRVQLYSAFPDLRDGNRFRGRLVQDLPAHLALLVDYGRVSAFQATTLLRSEEPSFRVMLRKSWDTPTPVRGSEVSGAVVDELGNPVPAAGVRLGSYLAFTGDDGRYRIAKVPPGEYQLSLAADCLPAFYAADGAEYKLVLHGSEHITVNLTAVPLNSIRGRVYHDRNGNERFDAGEGLAGMAVRLGEQVTGTAPDGSYGFYNLQPGPYAVSLDLQRPGETYALVSTGVVTLDLRAGRPAVNVDFQVTPKQKPIILQKFSK